MTLPSEEGFSAQRTGGLVAGSEPFVLREEEKTKTVTTEQR